MKKPNAFDETKASGEWTPIELGGHHLVIKKVEETKSQSGKDMIVVYFDFGKNDKQPDFMANEFRNDIRPDKKWPRSGTAYIVVEGDDGNCTRNFKTFISSFEHSNNCEANWGDKFTAQFKDKKVGAVFGEVENEYNGKVSMRHELRWFCSDDKADTAQIPAPKYLNGNSPAKPAANTSVDDNGFVKVPEGIENDLPF